MTKLTESATMGTTETSIYWGVDEHTPSLKFIVLESISSKLTKEDIMRTNARIMLSIETERIRQYSQVSEKSAVFAVPCHENILTLEVDLHKSLSTQVTTDLTGHNRELYNWCLNNQELALAFSLNHL